jgi:hypothetical protein
MNKHTPFTQRHQQGSIIVLFGGLLLVLTGFAVLAIDVGRIYIVRGELQNVADAAALAGANCLTRTNAVSATDCDSASATSLNWDRALAKARAQLSGNQADNQSILSSDAGNVIDVGYWDLLNKRPAGGTDPTSLMTKSFSPLGTNDKPAIRVTVKKATGQNGGPILMLTQLMYGGSDVPMSATSVAVISSPGSLLTGTPIPVVIEKCLFDQYWDSSTGTPKLADSTSLVGTSSTGNQTITVPQTIGQPWVFQLNADYPNATCSASKWFTVPGGEQVIKKLVATGVPGPLSIGDTVNIENGNVASGYQELKAKYPSLPVDLTLAVVNTNLASGSTPIYAFAGFRITAIQGAPGYLRGSFVSSSVSSSSSGIGPFFGAYTPPRLAY